MTIVRTSAGEIKGYEKDGVHYFKGVPFAAPPVGDLRFAPPQPLAPWEGTRDATEGCDAGAGATALDLAQEALADPRPVGDRLERGSPVPANVAQALAHVDFSGCLGRARGHAELLRSS